MHSPLTTTVELSVEPDELASAIERSIAGWMEPAPPLALRQVGPREFAQPYNTAAKGWVPYSLVIEEARGRDSRVKVQRVGSAVLWHLGERHAIEKWLVNMAIAGRDLVPGDQEVFRWVAARARDKGDVFDWRRHYHSRTATEPAVTLEVRCGTDLSTIPYYIGPTAIFVSDEAGVQVREPWGLNRERAGNYGPDHRRPIGPPPGLAASTPASAAAPSDNVGPGV